MTFILPKPLIPEQLDTDWYLLRVRPNYEDIAKDFLERRVAGAEVYYPTHKTLKRVGPPRTRRTVETVDRPVFQGYVYARFPVAWPDMVAIADVCSATPSFIMRMSHDGETRIPLYVRDKHVYEVRCLEERGQWDETAEEFVFSAMIGQKVAVNFGPFTGHHGKIKSIVGNTVRVGIRMLGKTAYIAMSINDAEQNLLY